MTAPSSDRQHRATPATPASAPAPAGPVAPRPSRPEVRRRGFFEVRWRQFRRAPRPVVRAVASSLSVALVLGILWQVYDIALDNGTQLPGGDLRLGLLTLYVVAVCVMGAVVTYLVVPLPTAGGTRKATRTPWSLALGLFAAVPIAYLVLVLLHEIVKPVLSGVGR
ncbi:MAG: hypothetical protein WCK58_11530 [Chloroflexota bacterium]